MKNRFSTNQNRQLSNKAIDSKLSLFDKSSRDLELFNLVDDELIRLSGSKIYYYKTYLDESYDKVYLESRNRIVSKTPVVLWASFDPSVIEEEMSEFGLELTNDQTFVFNKSYIEQNLGRGPIVGDIIKTTFQNIKYEIFEVQEDAFEGYGSYHYNCFAKVLRDSEEIVDEPNIDRFDRVGTSVYYKVGRDLVEMPKVFTRTTSEGKPEGPPPEGGGEDLGEITTIKWDNDGIIYVDAVNDVDGYYALGYLHAKEYGDALFGLLATSTGKCFDIFSRFGLQFNGNFLIFLEKHLAGGAVPWRINEDGSLNPDRNFFRVLEDFDRYLHFFNVPTIAQELYTELDTPTKAKVDSFTDGINAAINCLWDTSAFDISRSFVQTPPITFTPQDIMARDYLRAFAVWIGVYTSQIDSAKKIHREVRFEQVQEFAGNNSDFPLAGTLPIDPVEFELSMSGVEFDSVPAVEINSDLITKELAGQNQFFLSNEWAVHGSKTTTGKPILQTDPHLFQKDSWTRFINVSYASNATKMAGGMLAGIPNVLLGYNQDVAWALTANNTTSMRFYMFVVVRDGANPEQIRFFLATDEPTPDPNTGITPPRKLVPRLAEVEFKTYSATRPAMPVYRCEKIDRFDVGLILDTWYTDSVRLSNPLPKCARPVGSGPTPIYEVGIAAIFGKNAKFNGTRLFSKLNTARNVADVKAALAALDTPFYNFTYASRENIIGYYNLGIVPKFNGNPGYNNQWDPADPQTGSDRILLSNSYLFTHRNSLQFTNTVHPLTDLPHVENPAAGWLVGNNASPNYVSKWDIAGGGRDPKEIKVLDFPIYMHQTNVDFVFDPTLNPNAQGIPQGGVVLIPTPNRGNERQRQFFDIIGPNLQTPASVNTMKSIIGGKGGPANINEVPLHYAYVATNLLQSYLAHRNNPEFGQGVPLPQFQDKGGGIYRDPRSINFIPQKIITELTVWSAAVNNTNPNARLRASTNDIVYPRIHFFLERLYAHYGDALANFAEEDRQNVAPYAVNNIVFYSAAAGSKRHDTMTWNPSQDLLSVSSTRIAVAILQEAMEDFDQIFTTPPGFSQLFKANSSLEANDTTTGTIYPMNYGGKNLKTVTYNPIYVNGVLDRYEAFAGQVQALTVDFGPAVTQAHLLKPIHGSYRVTHPYFESLTQKWTNSDFATISSFGVFTGNTSQEVIINSSNPCQSGGNQ